MSSLPPGPPPPDPAVEPWPEIDCLAGIPLVDAALSPTWYSAGKVLVDYIGAVLLLPIALPLIALSAIAVRLTSSGSAFYTQTRLGLNGEPYKIIKIRTMHTDCELKSGIRWAEKFDDRVNRVGKFLRATHLDELPQLFNVLLGHMSLVGPRPERPEVIRAKGLEELVPGYAQRMTVKPGVTGLAQLQLAADTDITSVRYKVVYDLYYIGHQGLFLDLRLIAATVLKTVGLGPRALRFAFRLPDRDKVGDSFKSRLSTEHAALPQLQPA